MISEIITECPFAIQGLFWREGRFSISHATSMTTSADPLGRIDITLPDALIMAVPKRRSEFLAGRICAALALRAAGLPTFVGIEGRRPVWPEGVAGSISHSNGRAVAVISAKYSQIGVDCETVMAGDLAQKLHPEIISAAEVRLCPPDLTFAQFLTLIFSAKEAVYKALSMQLDTVPAFLDVTLATITSNRLYLVFQGQMLSVYYLRSQTDCVTLLAIDPRV